MSERSGRSGRAMRRAMVAGFALTLALGLPEGGAWAKIVGPAARPAPEPAMPLSSGCGRPAPAAAPSAVEVEGRSRGLITVVPAAYRADEPHKLVIAFHGRTNSNAKARRYFRLEEAVRGPTIFVYPSGLRRRDGGYSWAAPDDPTGAAPDVALFDAVVGKISSLYCIDRSRVFAVGHSLGAWFANSLGCARGDILRAIGTIAGALDGAKCRGGVAAMLFHNPRDRLVSYGYGLRARNLLRAENGVERPVAKVQLDGFVCERYGDDGASNPVLWCPYTKNLGHSGRYYPHHWPDGAGRAIMDFFAMLPDGAGAAAVQPVAAGPGAAGSAAR